MSLVFLWIRYVGLIGFGFVLIYELQDILQEQKDDTLCERYLQMQGIFSSVITATVDVVLVYRIWILYGKSRFVLTTLVVTALASLEDVVPSTKLNDPSPSRQSSILS
ncbi:hypothetical protein BDQ17DRAFT_1329214 [Cyathus striatus]|nr:hypothetical protein BDQ17DRAFT_1329214 [Cyathus striatus]